VSAASSHLNYSFHTVLEPEHSPLYIVKHSFIELTRRYSEKGKVMGRGILLWLLGVPIPVIILLALIWH
jgi:hypothetical protein